MQGDGSAGAVIWQEVTGMGVRIRRCSTNRRSDPQSVLRRADQVIE